MYDPKHLTICLKNSFRELLHLYCTKQNYPDIKALVEGKIAAQGTRSGEQQKKQRRGLFHSRKHLFIPF